MYHVVCFHSDAYNWTVACVVWWFPTYYVNYRTVSLPLQLMQNIENINTSIKHLTINGGEEDEDR